MDRTDAFGQNDAMGLSVRSALANLALVLVSLTATYLAASFLVLRFAYPHLSLNLRPHFPDLAEIFAQTSKSGTVPRDYIAILGDSYAEGQGDGLLNATGDRAKALHSAHVLQHLTNRDVISLAMGGAGSAQAMVRMPTRILRSGCFLYPALDAPRQILVYFYEGNDLDENGYVANVSAAGGAVTREKIERYIERQYATPNRWRCFTDLAETMFKMGHFLATNAESWETLRKPSAHNKVLVGAGEVGTPALQKPPVEVASWIDAPLTVFDISLGWLRRTYPATEIALVYIASPAALYRHADALVDVYTRWPLNEVRPVPAKEIYETSQRTCEQIRTMTLAHGVRFIDTRPQLRAAAKAGPIHGPQDWNHFNDAGYRVLGETLARTIEDKASALCVDWDG
jgi:hypothetical protein